MEIWKVIPGYEDYAVSSEGNVRSLKYNKIKELKQRNLELDYKLVSFRFKGKIKHFLVHRLVANVFLNLNLNSKMEVDHLNDNPADNRLINLKVVTPRENTGRAKAKKRNLPTGVTFYLRRNKFGARIYYNNKIHFLGYYKTAEEASEAYQEALKEIN